MSTLPRTMSTLERFERHKEQAQVHEERARMWLEDASTALRRRGPGHAATAAPAPEEEPRQPGAPTAKALRLALAQQRLALREWREAARLRPRDAEAKQRLSVVLASLRRLQGALAGPRALPLRRFLAHYNLSLRYWDLGRAKEALEEAEKACGELSKAGLPCGCAEHNLVLMAQVQAEHLAEQRRLQELAARAPEAVGPSYDLGVLFFDKRMLLRAEAQLRWARERARAASALHLVEQTRQRRPLQPALAERRAGRMANLLEELEDDLDFVGGLRELWCVEDEAGKAEELQATGLRDGARPRLLPCLRRRYTADDSVCARWWAELCGRTDVDLGAVRSGPKPR